MYCKPGGPEAENRDGLEARVSRGAPPPSAARVPPGPRRQVQPRPPPPAAPGLPPRTGAEPLSERVCASVYKAILPSKEEQNHHLSHPVIK